MSILEIELTPEMEKRLAEKARRKGMEAKAYAQTVMVQDLLAEDASIVPESEKRYNVMDFYGVGREAWAGVDVQQYISEMRDEWDR